MIAVGLILGVVLGRLAGLEWPVVILGTCVAVLALRAGFEILMWVYRR